MFHQEALSLMGPKRVDTFCFPGRCSEKSCGTILDLGSQNDVRTNPEKPPECMTTGGGPPTPPHRLYSELTKLDGKVAQRGAQDASLRAVVAPQTTPHIMRPAFHHPQQKRPWDRVRPSAEGGGGEKWSCIVLVSQRLYTHRFWAHESKRYYSSSQSIDPKVKSVQLVLGLSVRGSHGGRFSVFLLGSL